MKEQIRTLTSLRFFAALAVMLFHVPFVLPAATKEMILSKGSLGVGFFFVLSGFILTHAHYDEHVQPLEFYKKRIARVYPIHLLTLIIWCYLFYYSWGNNPEDKFNSFIPNVILMHSLFAGPLFTLGYNAVSWSLSVEVFFYLIFPLLRQGRVITGTLILLITAEVGIGRWWPDPNQIIPDFYYFNPLARLPEFVTGMGAYYLYNRMPSLRFPNCMEISSLIVVIIACSFNWPSKFYFTGLGVLFSVLIVIFAKQEGIISGFLSRKIFVVLGESSYSLYMIHHMYLRWLNNSIGGKISGEILLVVGLLTTILLSVLLYYAFEKPARRFIIRNLAASVKAELPSTMI